LQEIRKIVQCQVWRTWYGLLINQLKLAIAVCNLVYGSYFFINDSAIAQQTGRSLKILFEHYPGYTGEKNGFKP
jgi:hypothetical protein